MGKGKKLVLVAQPGKDQPYYLTRGGQTFYDEEDIHIRFHEHMEAYEWAEEYLGILPSHHLPDAVREKAEQHFEDWKDSERQERLF